MTRQHKDLASRSPRGPGHHSKDGRQWWDDGHQRWFSVTDLEDSRRRGSVGLRAGARLEELHQQLLLEGDRPGVATGGGRGATGSGGGVDQRRTGQAGATAVH